MKINYTDADGRILELEVSAEVGEFYLASIEEEKSNDRANTRRHTSLSAFEYEDIRFFNSGIDIEGEYALSDAVLRAMDKLSERQRYLFTKVYIEGWKFTELAKLEERDESTIRKAAERAKEIFKNNFL
jgi:RNA polymerase sigma-70 factor (ECF subfamily)